MRVFKTREVETDLNDLFMNTSEGDEVWIITPYATMNKLGSLRRTISDTCAKGVNVSFVVRDEPKQVDPAKRDLKEAIDNGLKLYAFKRLHAKVYWFEELGCLVTSANLVDGSFEASTEIGLGIQPSKIHDEVRGWIEDEIVPGLRLIGGTQSKTKKREPKKKSHSKGYCIRCKDDIPYNARKPYCSNHFKSWAKYENPDYPEKYCHSCGESNKSSIARPVCYACFKSNK